MQFTTGVAAPARCVPCLRLFAETLYVDDGSRHGDEVQTAMLRLDFDYQGRRIRSGDPRTAGRDRDAEMQGLPHARGPRRDRARAPRRLRGVAGLRRRLRGARSTAMSTRCARSRRHAVPQLRALGWRIDDRSRVSLAGRRRRRAALRVGAARQASAPTGSASSSASRSTASVSISCPRCSTARQHRRPRVADPVGAPLRRGPGRRQALAAGAARAAAPAREGAGRAVSRERQGPRAGDPRAADRRAVLHAARRRAPDAVGRRHQDPRPGLRDGARPAAPARRSPRPTGCAPSCARTSATAWRGCSTCATHGAGGVLADDMGLGKTLQTIAHILLEKEQGRLDRPAMIVTLTSLVGNWQREIAAVRAARCTSPSTTARIATRRCAQLGTHDVVITTYPMIARDRDDAREAAAAPARPRRGARDQEPDAQARRGGAQPRRAPPRVPVGHADREPPRRAVVAVRLPDARPARRRARSSTLQFRQPIEDKGDKVRLDALRDRVRPYILRRTKDAGRARAAARRRSWCARSS